jgi:hypothetical protein
MFSGAGVYNCVAAENDNIVANNAVTVLCLKDMLFITFKITVKKMITMGVSGENE